MVRLLASIPAGADTRRLFRGAQVRNVGNFAGTRVVEVNIPTTERGARRALNNRADIVRGLRGRVLNRQFPAGVLAQVEADVAARAQAAAQQVQFVEQRKNVFMDFITEARRRAFLERRRQERILEAEDIAIRRRRARMLEQERIRLEQERVIAERLRVYALTYRVRLGGQEGDEEESRVVYDTAHTQTGNYHRDGFPGTWRDYTFTVELLPRDLNDKIEELRIGLEALAYVQFAELSQRHVAPAAAALDVRDMLNRFTPEFTRTGVENVSPAEGLRCAVDVVYSVFGGQISNGKHRITWEDIRKYFAVVASSKGRREEDGYTLDEIRGCVEWLNGSYFVGFNVWGEKVVFWKNPSKRSSARGGLCCMAVDGHAWLFRHEKGSKISAGSFSPVGPMPKGMYCIQQGEISLDVVEKLPVSVVYCDDLSKVHSMFEETVRGGHIPRISGISEDNCLIRGFVTAGGKHVKYVPGAVDGERFAIDMGREFNGKSVYNMGLQLLEKMGFERSHLCEDARAIFASQHYYHHQWYIDEASVQLQKVWWGVDVRRCFTWCLTQRLPVFQVGDEPCLFGGIIRDVGFYFVDCPEAQKWPLFGRRRWYLGALVARLVSDGELPASGIKMELVPSGVSDGRVVKSWLERVKNCSDSKGVVNGCIGFMKASSVVGEVESSCVLTSFAEARAFDGASKLLVLDPAGNNVEEIAEGDKRFAWLCTKRVSGSVGNSNFLPQWLSVACYASLRVYMAARTVIGRTDWRSAIKAVCVDSLAIDKRAVLVGLELPMKEDCSDGDIYHSERTSRGVYDLAGPKIRGVRTEPVDPVWVWEPRDVEWKNVSANADVLDGPGCLFNAGGGWGKSYFMRELIGLAEKRGLSYLVIGPTGIVKDNYLSAGITCETAHRALAIDMEVAPLWTSSVDIVFIDEVFAMQSVCMARVAYNKKRWGTRIFMCGDSCQNAPPDGSGGIRCDGAFMHWLSGGMSVVGVKNHRVVSGGRNAWFAAWLDSYRDMIMSGATDIQIPWSEFQTSSDIVGLAVCPTLTKCDSINASRMQKGVRYRGVRFDIFRGMQLISRQNRIKYYNGQIWTVVDILRESVGLRHNKTGRTISVEVGELGDFIAAYAITCHKLQCETLRDNHTIVDAAKGVKIFGHRWLYTALSRACSWDLLYIHAAEVDKR